MRQRGCFSLVTRPNNKERWAESRSKFSRLADQRRTLAIWSSSVHLSITSGINGVDMDGMKGIWCNLLQNMEERQSHHEATTSAQLSLSHPCSEISPCLLLQLQRLYTLLCSAFTDTLDRFSVGVIPVHKHFIISKIRDCSSDAHEIYNLSSLNLMSVYIHHIYRTGTTFTFPKKKKCNQMI